MTEWKYNLGGLGRRLRESIDEDESSKTLRLLRDCCQRMMKSLKGADIERYRDDFEDLYNVMDGEAETIEENPDEIQEWGFEDENDLVNARLAEFYDLCDGCKAWVSI